MLVRHTRHCFDNLGLGNFHVLNSMRRMTAPGGKYLELPVDHLLCLLGVSVAMHFDVRKRLIDPVQVVA